MHQSPQNVWLTTNKYKLFAPYKECAVWPYPRKPTKPDCQSEHIKSTLQMHHFKCINQCKIIFTDRKYEILNLNSIFFDLIADDVWRTVWQKLKFKNRSIQWHEVRIRNLREETTFKNRFVLIRYQNKQWLVACATSFLIENLKLYQFNWILMSNIRSNNKIEFEKKYEKLWLNKWTWTRVVKVE